MIVCRLAEGPAGVRNEKCVCVSEESESLAQLAFCGCCALCFCGFAELFAARIVRWDSGGGEFPLRAPCVITSVDCVCGAASQLSGIGN